MKITQDIIENELISYFNPFAYIAVRNGYSEGGFDVQLVDDTTLKFIIFDLKWEDEDKEEIWSLDVDVSKYDTILSLKAGIASQLEFSIHNMTD